MFRDFVYVCNRLNVSDGHRVLASFDSCVHDDQSVPLGNFYDSRVLGLQSFQKRPQAVQKKVQCFIRCSSHGAIAVLTSFHAPEV